MTQKEHLIIIIDELEYYITKNIEKYITYGAKDRSYVALNDMLLECIAARKKIGYVPNQSVKALLEDHGYEDDFINKFFDRVHLQKMNSEGG